VGSEKIGITYRYTGQLTDSPPLEGARLHKARLRMIILNPLFNLIFDLTLFSVLWIMSVNICH